MRKIIPTTWKKKIRHFLLDLDARIDSTLFSSGKGARELYERYSTFMDRFYVGRWKRWVFIEPLSEAATIGLGGLVLMLALAVPAFRETADEDWLKKSDLAVTFLDRYGNPIGSRGIKHNDSIPLEDFPDNLIKATLATEDRRFYDHFGIDVAGTVPRAGDQRPGRRRAPGRFVDHPATGQEPVPEQRAHHRAQGQRGVPRDLAGDAAHQERNSEALSRPRLYGRRHFRRRRRGAFLLQQVGARRQSGGSRDAGRPVQGADQIRAAHQPARRPRPRQRGAGQSRRRRLHDRRPGVRRPAQSGHRGRPPRREFAELLSRLGVRRDAQAGRHLPEILHRARVRGPHLDRHERAARRRRSHRKPVAPVRPRLSRDPGRHRGRRSRRRHPRHGRRPRLRRQPVQPRRRRLPAARLVVQALCLHHRAAERLQAELDRGRRPGLHRQLVSAELWPLLFRRR